MFDLPVHIGRLRIVSLDQAALVMAGISEKVDSVQKAVEGNYIGHEQASIYKETIIQAIQLKELKPLQAFKLADYKYGLPEAVRLKVDVESITLDTPIVNATFLAKDIWPWVANEIESGLRMIDSHSPDLDSEQCNEDLHESTQWGNFAGKDTALKLIAGMAIALEKSQGKYLRGGKLNKSEVARTATKLINDHGDGIDVTSKALIMLIDEALELHASKISK